MTRRSIYRVVALPLPVPFLTTTKNKQTQIRAHKDDKTFFLISPLYYMSYFIQPSPLSHPSKKKTLPKNFRINRKNHRIIPPMNQKSKKSPPTITSIVFVNHSKNCIFSVWVCQKRNPRPYSLYVDYMALKKAMINVVPLLLLDYISIFTWHMLYYIIILKGILPKRSKSF